MRRAIFVVALVFGLAAPAVFAQEKSAPSAAADPAPQPPAILAETPPLGWNSWDSYGLTINEADYKANVKWFHQHLKFFGWRYVVIDEGWYLKNPESGGKPAWQYTVSGDGLYLPAVNRFPSAANDAGFKPLADYVHSLGLKFGLHIIRGIPKEAVEKNLPIAGGKFHAADAADTSDTCRWNPDNYGVRANAAGQAYYDSVAALYAKWGLDFLKVDCITVPFKGDEIRMLSEGIKKTGRPIVLSLSPGPTPIDQIDELRKYAQMWRISDDFWDSWKKEKPGENFPQSLQGQFAMAAKWAPLVEAGHWPDADMLPLGHLGPVPGWGPVRDTRLTHDEQRTLLTLWSMLKSPLVIGANLTQMDGWTTSLLTNAEVLGVDQRSKGGHPVVQTDTTVIWLAESHPSGYFLAVFNLGDSPQTVQQTWKSVGLNGASYRVRDLWEHADRGIQQQLSVPLAPHAAVLYRVAEFKQDQ
jgi:alpha-galactosidase